MKLRLRCATLGAGFLLAACATRDPGESQTLLPGQNVLPPEVIQVALRQKVEFRAHVRPILQAKCVVCHDAEAQPGAIHLESRAAAARSGVLTGFIIPGDPERSLLLTKIKGSHAHIKAMPPVGEQLTRDEVAILRRWISQGAEWPDAD